MAMKESFLHLQSSPDYNVMPDTSKNILENFITTFTHHKEEYFAWDNVSGSSKRGDFMLKAAVVSNLLKSKTQHKNIGIMLPALQSTTLLIMASYMAGKIPVMLNWTVGNKVLVHCAEITDLDIIITATSFFEKVKEQIPSEIEGKLMFLDKEVKNITTPMKLKGVLMAKFPKLFINTKIDETAVVLFTSGSETLPKAVRLTHKNIVHDLNGALHIIDIRVQSIFLSFLPPFHSFGFTVLSVLPLLTGVKVAYTPNPTNIGEVVETIKHVQANNLIATPTLLKMIMNKASREDFKTIELVITGAESLHETIKNQFNELTKGNTSRIIEGYGITECAPIVSLNPVDAQKTNSVGKIIKGLEIKVVNPDSFEEVEVAKEGMFIVSGPSVFPGYLDVDIQPPFIEIQGKRFYKTGDLGYIDADGFLFITGRLKRFIKIAGEMISMPFIENILKSECGNNEEINLAVEGSDKGGEPKVVLFSTKEMDLSEINRCLREKGVASIARIREIKVVNEIPLLGSGKTNYRLLKEIIEKEV
jgi:long-chain-fatty-acid--[acyl-carrier-protein] ligase